MDIYYIEKISWDYLFNYVSNGESLGVILRYLDDKEEKEFVEKMGWEAILECIRTPNDLSYVFTGFNVQNEKEFIEKLDKDKHRKILPAKEILDAVCKYQLGIEEAKLLREKYE